MGDGAGRKNGSGAYVIYDCVILTKEVRTFFVCDKIRLTRCIYRGRKYIFWNGIQRLKSCMIYWREVYLLVAFFFQLFRDSLYLTELAERSMLFSHHSLPYLQRQLLHVFVQLSWMDVANYSNFGLPAFCCIPSWVEEMTCGLGY